MSERDITREYYLEFSSAFVRGSLLQDKTIELARKDLFEKPLAELSQYEQLELFEIGKAAKLKLHKFKITMGLARVQTVLGILRGLAPDSLLDVGSGRGVFLWPLLTEFKHLPVKCIDQNPIRCKDIEAVRKGGIERLSVLEGKIESVNLKPASFDIVTALEVLEHIDSPEEALVKALSLAKRFLIISVPSHEDDNEEHIHLFNRQSLSSILSRAGAKSCNIQYVHNHIIAVARVS